MDRERIERRDFPTGRRGYDPAAVDEHLRRLADEFESRTAHAPAPSMADSTSEQVRLILEAAERGAAELRGQAGAEASGHVTRVQTAADGMLAKLDALESELSRLLSALRVSGERLVEGLADLQSQAAEGLTPPGPPAERQLPRVEPENRDTREVAQNGNGGAPGPGAEAGDPPGAADDAGARLIALNMALGGSPREDTKAFLAEHFSLPDLEGLLDDVYARAGR